MEEQYISYEVAKLAKEKGFNWPSEYYYQVVNNIMWKQGYSSDTPFNCNSVKQYYTCVTQSLLQKWLREEHKLNMEIMTEDNSPYTSFYYRIMKLGQYFTQSHHGLVSLIYEEVLEAALLEALTLIK